MFRKMFIIFIILVFAFLSAQTCTYASNYVSSWSSSTIIKDIDVSQYQVKKGVEFGRMLKLTNGDWLVVYTVFDTDGYDTDPQGGSRLEVAVSSDDCRTWNVVSSITDPGRDLDNGQMIQTPEGDILLACRSVRWFESYKLDVYKSTDLGENWSYLSTIDENNGDPGELGNPQKGVYEPYLGYLDDGSLAVYYANEKHVIETPSYEQIISEKISSDGGETWGDEIWVAWDTQNSIAKPGMPVWTKMSNGKYIVVFEVCGTDDANVHYKISDDGYTWSSGVGTRIPDQMGAPFITKLSNGTLGLVSNEKYISFSDNNGDSWYRLTDTDSPWGLNYAGWRSLYQTKSDEIAVISSVQVDSNEQNVQIKFGSIGSSPIYKYEAEDATVNNAIIYTSSNASGNEYVGGINYADSYIEYDNINVPLTGKYTLEVRYANGMTSDSTHNLTVNSGSAQAVTYVPTGGWGQFGTLYVPVDLGAGSNTIKFSKGIQYAELDCIHILPIRYEAEDGILNHGIVYSGAYASGEKFIGGLDYSDSHLDFNDVIVKNAGTYTLTMRYANGTGANSSLDISANGVYQKTENYPATSGWGMFSTITTDITLNAGSNSISFAKNNSYIQLDYIHVQPARYEAEEATVNNAEVRSSLNASNGYFVGGIDYSDSYVEFTNINVPITGNYTLEIRYANGMSSNSTHNLTVNGSSQTVTYPPTAGWAQFSTVDVTINLNAGNNTIKLAKNYQYAELDYVKIQ